VIRSWDGNAASPDGPDVFDLSVAGGPRLLHTTFSNVANRPPWDRQAYPDPYPGGDHPAYTGAVETNTLGYTAVVASTTVPMDAVYPLTYAFPHAGTALALDFAGGTTEPADNESWGLANVEVRAAPPVARVVVFRPSTHEWFQRNGDGSTTVVQWGGP